MHGSLDPPESKPQTASQSLKLFLISSWQGVAILYNGLPLFPLKLPTAMGHLNTHLLHGCWAHSTRFILVSSAVFAQLTAQRLCTLQWAALPPLHIDPSKGDLDPI